jgi:hypothetical protein
MGHLHHGVARRGVVQLRVRDGLRRSGARRASPSSMGDAGHSPPFLPGVSVPRRSCPGVSARDPPGTPPRRWGPWLPSWHRPGRPRPRPTAPAQTQHASTQWVRLAPAAASYHRHSVCRTGPGWGVLQRVCGPSLRSASHQSLPHDRGVAARPHHSGWHHRGTRRTVPIQITSQARGFATGGCREGVAMCRAHGRGSARAPRSKHVPAPRPV